MVHGHVVPEISYYGTVDGADPPLTIYTMSYLRGIRALTLLFAKWNWTRWRKPGTFALSGTLLGKEYLFPRLGSKYPSRLLMSGRYFARCWSKPQYTTMEARADTRDTIQHRLTLLMASPLSIPGASAISKLEHSLPALFGQEYPQNSYTWRPL